MYNARLKARQAYEARCLAEGRTPTPYRPTKPVGAALLPGEYRVVTCYTGGNSPMCPTDVFTARDITDMRRLDLIPEGAVITRGGCTWRYENAVWIEVSG